MTSILFCLGPVQVEIPAMDDPVSKLEHMGRETVKKLADLQAAAAQQGANLAGLEPEYCRIEKVGQQHSTNSNAAMPQLYFAVFVVCLWCAGGGVPSTGQLSSF